MDNPMLRSLLKTGVALALHATNSDRLLAKIGGSRRLPLVIGYHRTVEEFPSDELSTIPSMCISTRMLERQLDWIGRRFRFVSLDELGALMESGNRLPERIAAVTFDDGYQDVYEHAFPLLKKKGIPAAVFVVTDLLGTSQLQIHDLLYLLLGRANSKWGSAPQAMSRFLANLGISLSPSPGMANIPHDPHAGLEVLLGILPQSEVLRVIEALQAEVKIPQDILREHRAMSWQEVMEMHAAGITIGSHSQTHAMLPNETAEKVKSETAGSRETLEKWLGESVRHFAYPCGQYNAATVKAVAQAGYRFGYTICKHRDSNSPLLTIPRKMLWENSCLNALGSFSPSILSCHVHGSFDLVAGCKLNHAPFVREGVGSLSDNRREVARTSTAL
jgi:peptidoglycan/xylan/chitin deacetylase (PgdA/CDA1 family)